MQIEIIAATVDNEDITLYKTDGQTLVIRQGDVRVQYIIDEVLPILQRGGIASVTFPDATNDYRKVEESSNGLIRFFRVARNTLARALGSGRVAPAGTYGTPEAVNEPLELTHDMKQAVIEIVSNSIPAASSDFHTTEDANSTVVAVVNDQVITDTEKLTDIISHSVRNRNTVGVRNLLERLSKIVSERRHSVEDVMRFLEKADLPIADDGSIIAYKALARAKRDGVEGYVDLHTRRVFQAVGCKVQIPDELVDLNRRNECSAGLHIARRSYLGSFGGDVCVICKIEPEDIMVVPHNDPNKVRVRAYHILAELPREAYQLLKSDRPATKIQQVAKLLGLILKGEHTPVTQIVTVGGTLGTNVTAQATDAKLPDRRAVKKQARKVEAAKPVTAVASKDSLDHAKIDPLTIVEDQQKKAAQPGSRQQRAAELVKIIETSQDPVHIYKAAQSLILFKKSSKVGWDRLGVSPAMVAKATNIAEGPEPASAVPAETAAKAPPKAKKVIKAAKVTKSTKKALKPAQAVNKAVKLVNRPGGSPGTKEKKMQADTTSTENMTREQKARFYFDNRRWGDLWQLKKTSRYSFEALGLTSKEAERAKLNKPNWI